MSEVPHEAATQNEPAGNALHLLAVLSQLIADGKGPDDLIAALAESTDSAAVIEDGTGAPLWYLPERLAAERERLLPYLPYKTSPSLAGTKNFARLPLQPVQITDSISGLTLHRLVSPVTAGGDRLAVLSLLRADKPFSSGESTCLGHAAGLFAVQLAQEKRIAEIELRLKGNFVDDLVSLRYSDPDSILNRARALDINIALPHRVLVGEIENLGQVMNHLNDDQKAAAKFRTELAGKIQSLIDSASGGMATHKNDEIIMLVRQDRRDGPIDSAKRLAEEIINAVSPLFRIKLYIGIGSTCSELADYQNSYLEAKKALEVGAFMITEGQVRSFEQFKIHALFLSTLKPAELYKYARSQLGTLLDYDERHNTELLKTLQEFLYLRNNVEGTAKNLNMSVSGLKYRLQKIERIIGIDLKDYKACFDLQLALIILQLFGEYRIRNQA